MDSENFYDLPPPKKKNYIDFFVFMGSSWAVHYSQSDLVLNKFIFKLISFCIKCLQKIVYFQKIRNAKKLIMSCEGSRFRINVP